MKILWRVLKTLSLTLAGVLVLLVSPVAYTETMCRAPVSANPYAPILAPEHHRPEARTFMTYPEWHIVHAYDDYARVLTTGDPHDFGFLRAVAGYWSSLCALTETSAGYGGVDGSTKQLVYVIGVSFTLELALKAAYEETLGRMATILRGQDPAPLDRLSSEQASAYARFLQQVPWYEWDFDADAAALSSAATPGLRDRERNMALGLEYKAKSAYADVIAQAVADTGGDALTLRMIVSGVSEAWLSSFPDVTVIAQRPEGIEVETPRYRKLTGILDIMARDGAVIEEIAGNDDILMTALSLAATHEDAIYSFARQGYGDHRHLFVLKVRDLSHHLRSMSRAGLKLEHIHDY